METVYLDNAATTIPCRSAIDAINRILSEHPGNPSSQHRMGMEAEAELKRARELVAKALGCKPAEVYFTSGGTEADNWAVFSAAAAAKKGGHIITTAIEHSAVYEPVRELEQRGWAVTYLKPDSSGGISAEDFKSALREDTALVSVMLVNNETGALMPVNEISRILKSTGSRALLHTDAVQGFLKVPFNAAKSGADMISVSAHKIHAVKGAGALYIRSGLRLKPLIYGGGQEQSYRSGTEAMPAIAAFGAACEEAMLGLSDDISRMTRLRKLAAMQLKERLPRVEIIGDAQAPHILCIGLPGLRSQGIINCMQDRGVYVSAGSACGRGKRSRVLEAMGIPARTMDGMIRVSLSRFTTEEEILIFCRALEESAAQLG